MRASRTWAETGSNQLEEVSKCEEEVRRFEAMGAAESDFVDYRVRSGSCQDLFSALDVGGSRLSVAALDWTLERGRLECRYTLRGRAGIGSYPVYPVSLVGIALEGRILEVKGNQVRVHMDIDDPYSGPDVYWFPYATMSASLKWERMVLYAGGGGAGESGVPGQICQGCPGDQFRQRL